MWMCAVHNRVNERLGKAEFDCTKVSSAVYITVTAMKLGNLCSSMACMTAVVATTIHKVNRSRRNKWMPVDAHMMCWFLCYV